MAQCITSTQTLYGTTTVNSASGPSVTSQAVYTIPGAETTSYKSVCESTRDGILGVPGECQGYRTETFVGTGTPVVMTSTVVHPADQTGTGAVSTYPTSTTVVVSCPSGSIGSSTTGIKQSSSAGDLSSSGTSTNLNSATSAVQSPTSVGSTTMAVATSVGMDTKKVEVVVTGADGQTSVFTSFQAFSTVYVYTSVVGAAITGGNNIVSTSTSASSVPSSSSDSSVNSPGGLAAGIVAGTVFVFAVGLVFWAVLRKSKQNDWPTDDSALDDSSEKINTLPAGSSVQRQVTLNRRHHENLSNTVQQLTLSNMTRSRSLRYAPLSDESPRLDRGPSQSSSHRAQPQQPAHSLPHPQLQVQPNGQARGQVRRQPSNPTPGPRVEETVADTPTIEIRTPSVRSGRSKGWTDDGEEEGPPGYQI